MNTININDMRRLAGLSEISVKKDLTRVSESGRRGLPNDSHPVNRRNLKEQDMNNDTSNRVYYCITQGYGDSTPVIQVALTPISGGDHCGQIEMDRPCSLGDTLYAIEEYVHDEYDEDSDEKTHEAPHGEYVAALFSSKEEAENYLRTQSDYPGVVREVEIEEANLSEAEEGGENIFTIRYKLTDRQLKEMSRLLGISESIIINQSKNEDFFPPIDISPETLNEIVEEYRSGSPKYKELYRK